jgi:hypothetical protein
VRGLNDANSTSQLESISLSQLRQRRRKPSRRAAPAPPPKDPASSSSSEAESDEEAHHTTDDNVHTASDSALETPAEDGFVSSVSQPSKGIRGIQRANKKELAAVKLAKFVGKDVSEMFAGFEGTRKNKIEHSGMADAVPAYVL